MAMRILTVRQPWAWAIIHQGKDVENRTRNLAGNYRGPLAIHVALKDDDDWEERDASAFISSCPNRDHHHNRFQCDWCTKIEPLVWKQHGHIIGVVDLVDVHEVCGPPFSDGAWPICSYWAEDNVKHLVLANPRPLREPFPYRGALHLQSPTAAETAEILRRAS